MKNPLKAAVLKTVSGKRMDDYGDGSTYQRVVLEYDLYERGDTPGVDER